MNLFTGCGWHSRKQRHKHWPELTRSYLGFFFPLFRFKPHLREDVTGLRKTATTCSLTMEFLGRGWNPGWKQGSGSRGCLGVKDREVKRNPRHPGGMFSSSYIMEVPTAALPDTFLSAPATFLHSQLHGWSPQNLRPGSSCAQCWERSRTKAALLLRSASKHHHNAPLSCHSGGI